MRETRKRWGKYGDKMIEEETGNMTLMEERKSRSEKRKGRREYKRRGIERR